MFWKAQRFLLTLLSWDKKTFQTPKHYKYANRCVQPKERMMIEWLLNRKANRLVYLFYSPWLLMLFFPLTPFYGKAGMTIYPLLFIFWVQITFYIYFTIGVCKRLFSLEKEVHFEITEIGFKIHSWINFILITLTIFRIIISGLKEIDNSLSMVLFVIFSISELFRGISMSKLIVSLELKRKVFLKDYIWTLYLVINPLLGLWNLHDRIKKLITDR